MSAATGSTAGSTQTSTDPEVTAYARQVREALADVPPARLEELLEDLEEHLVEVASETPGPLTDRLGAPATYAAELRRAAGLPDALPQPVAGADRVGAPSRWLAQLKASEPYRHVVAFLPELRPAWWVARAWAGVAAVDVVVRGEVAVPLPTLGLGVLGWAITAAAVVWSVRLGLRSRAAGRPLTHLVAFANLGLAVCALVAVVGVADRSGGAGYPETVSYDSGPTTLTHEDGTPITNIVPYGPDGTPLTGVLLYDQDGRPIDNLSTWTTDGSSVDPQREVPAQPDNAYPQAQVVTSHDQYGNTVEEEFPAPTTATPTTAAPPTP